MPELMTAQDMAAKLKTFRHAAKEKPRFKKYGPKHEEKVEGGKATITVTAIFSSRKGDHYNLRVFGENGRKVYEDNYDLETYGEKKGLKQAIKDAKDWIQSSKGKKKLKLSADESDTEARFTEGPEGKKEFDAWIKKQPKKVQEEWAENTQKYKDKFDKGAGQVEDEEKAQAAEERAEADQEKAQAERSEAEADRSDAASKEAGKVKGPGKPDGTGPGKDSPECPHSDKEAGFHRERLTWNREAAVAPGGMYGFTKADQRDCEASIRKVQRQAMKIARVATKKDPRVAAFVSTHAKRAKSTPAKILVAAIRELQPKLAMDKEAGDKEAARGLYGFRAKTATLGLNACSEIRAFTGEVAYNLHSRREARYASITGFLKEHGKQAKCNYARMLLSAYPDPATGKTASVPESVEEWLTWE